MRFILVSVDDPSLKHPVEIPDEMVGETMKELPSRKKKSKKPSPEKPIKTEPTAKRFKTNQRSRVYG